MERRAVSIRGIVQGVGFRPFVYSLASRLDLRGFTRNQSWGLQVEVEGEIEALDQFLHELKAHHPPLAQIEQIAWQPQPPKDDPGFHIESSACDDEASVFIAPDVATCDRCLAELFDPRDRRYRYPFLNCTNCGPRLTIVTGTPYDRARTTMADFAMCGACRSEYENPVDRRFHAQPTACANCGPRLDALAHDGTRITTRDPLAHFVEALRAGSLGALKGLGGYHLVCDARNDAAVSTLRYRKHRYEKPFAIMVRDADAAAALCEVSEAERALLVSPRRPIVLLRKRAGAAIAAKVAPKNACLGVMLPYTPVHHLLMQAMDRPVVMTSGNRSDEPIAYCDADAVARLGPMVDLLLVHDRPIHVRCDDSVMRTVADETLPVRRSRGYAPQPIKLPLPCPAPILAVGGQAKVTFALGREGNGFLSHHIGDLDHYEAYRAFERDVAHYQSLFAIRPEMIVHDLHSDYASTRYAQQRAAREGLTSVAVQHHHAHVASCMAEHHLSGPVIGVALDGSGAGGDGTVWGGEFLIADYHSFQRAAHLREVGMPGGERAVREPWRMALAHLADSDCACAPMTARLPTTSQRVVRRMLEHGLNTPRTSSAGRLFDAVAALAGVRDKVSHEGQAAIELESLASNAEPDTAYPFELVKRGADDAAVDPFTIDTRPLIRAVVEDVQAMRSAARIARRFHSSMVEIIVATCDRLRQGSGIEAVVLSGGVFQNALLTREASERLIHEGFIVHRHRQVPPNDGGLSLGQLAIAAARIRAESAESTDASEKEGRHARSQAMVASPSSLPP